MRKPIRNYSSGALNIAVSPKVHFIASVAARYRGKTMAEFIEDAIKFAILPASIFNDEPKADLHNGPLQEPSYWMDGLWSENEAIRLFNLAVFRHDLLPPWQRSIWLSFSSKMAKEGKALTQQNFIAFYDSLEEGSN